MYHSVLAWIITPADLMWTKVKSVQAAAVRGNVLVSSARQKQLVYSVTENIKSCTLSTSHQTFTRWSLSLYYHLINTVVINLLTYWSDCSLWERLRCEERNRGCTTWEIRWGEVFVSSVLEAQLTRGSLLEFTSGRLKWLFRRAWCYKYIAFICGLQAVDE